MGPLDLLLHLLNFAAPAACVALLTALISRIFIRKQPLAPGLWAQFAINFVVCLVALVAGLWFFGRDGKMAGYAALVVCCATSQWWMLRNSL
jgi:hypothetical protein